MRPLEKKGSPRWCFHRTLWKKVSPTHKNFEPKFLIFETKSDFFPIGKNDVTKFPNTNNFISPELHLTKFWEKSENFFFDHPPSTTTIHHPSQQVGADAWNPALDIQKAKYCKAIYLFPKALSTVFLSQKASEYWWLRTARARLVTARARLAGVGFQHSTCKTSRGGIFIKEILYKFFRPHETKGLSSLVFLPQNFRNFFFYKGNSL